MGPLHHHPEFGSMSHNTLSQASENPDLDSVPPRSPSQYPEIDLENVHLQPQSESSFGKAHDDEPPSLNGDLNPQLKEHTGAELALVSFCTLSFLDDVNLLHNPSLPS